MKSRVAPVPRQVRPPKADLADLPLHTELELVVLSARPMGARCRLPRTGGEMTLRGWEAADLVPGEITSVVLQRAWTCNGHPYAAGLVTGSRLDVDLLDLAPLVPIPQGVWDPARDPWRDASQGLPDWARPILQRGPRPRVALEPASPAPRPDGEDPLVRAAELAEDRDSQGARRALMDVLAADLRCIEAHAQLGGLAFEPAPGLALRHYRVGVALGDRTLGPGFTGVAPWSLADNRPFLRCLHGYGLCLWREGRMGGAVRVFERLLWLNPADEQASRVVLDQVRSGATWDDLFEASGPADGE